MDRFKIKCKVKLIAIELKKLQQCTELVADYLQDDSFDSETAQAIVDALDEIKDSALIIKGKAEDTAYTAFNVRKALEAEEAKNNEIV